MKLWGQKQSNNSSTPTTPAGGGSLRISIGGLDNKYHTPLYILITITLFTIASITILSIRFTLTGAVGNEGIVILNDSGMASLTSVNIDKLGSTNSDGSPITVTYSDGSTLTPNRHATNSDGTNKNEVLNNDEVVYDVNLNITTPGQITLSLTMPANNVINEASVSEANGCLSGSKVESADITNSDGAITKSYTNNKATCIINPTTTGSLTWSVSTNPWGGNNEQITPTIAISNQTQSATTSNTPIPTVTTIGKGDYGVEALFTRLNGSVSGGAEMMLYLRLYGHRSQEYGSIGVSPIDGGGLTITADTFGLPDGYWINVAYAGIGSVDYSGSTPTSVVHMGSGNADIMDGGASLEINIYNAVTGAMHCPISDVSGTIFDADKCYYSGAVISMVAPVESLTAETQSYTMDFDNPVISVGSNADAWVNIVPRSGGWKLSNRGSSNATIWPIHSGSYYPGWADFWTANRPIYTGQSYVNIAPTLQTNIVIGGDITTNLQYCVAWKPSQYAIVSGLSKTEDRYLILSDYKAQYGIIGTDMSVLPSSSQQYCGKVGDENIPGQMMFFDTLEEANTYAKQNGLAVNAMRLWSAETKAGIRDGRLGVADFAVVGDSLDTTTSAPFNVSATSDQWDKRDSGIDSDLPYQWGPVLTPGLLSHTITAIPSSTAPNAEDHIAITTKTYNKDTNSKITTILPNGLIPKAGSFTITNKEGNKLSLTEGDNQDYTLSSGCYANLSSSSSTTSSTSTTSDGCTITFNLDHIVTNTGIPITGYDPILPGQTGTTNGSNTITNPSLDNGGDGLPIAADNDGNGITHTNTPIEFDVVVDKDTPTPSTLTINSTSSGTGTNYASSTFKEAKASVAIATKKQFGYTLSSNASSVYALDDLTYTISNSNTLDADTANLTTINVLPYDGDSRGTNGLIEQDNDSTTTSTSTTPYTLTSLTVSGSNGATKLSIQDLVADGLTVFYTTDQTVRELEKGNPAALNDSNGTITWHKLTISSDGTITIPEDVVSANSITALKLTKPTLARNNTISLTYTLADIQATGNTASPSLIGNSINYTYADAIPTPAVNPAITTTKYLGDYLSLRLDPNNLTTNIEPNQAKLDIHQTLTLQAKVLSGYNLTMQAKTADGELVGTQDNARTIPTITKQGIAPTKGTANWAMMITGSNNPDLLTGSSSNTTTWLPVPGQNSSALSLYTTTIPGQDINRQLTIAYGVSTSQNTIADTYRAEVVYTLVAEP